MRLLLGGRGLGGEGNREARFLTVGRGALDDAGLDGLVVGGVDAGEQLDGFILFAIGYDGAEFPFQAAQIGGDAAVVQVFAGAIAHAAFG